MKVSTEHSSLQKFLIESALYERVGLNFETLKLRPLKEVQDYITIINVIANEEKRQRAKQDAELNKGKQRY
jgi:hypothetical protein